MAGASEFFELAFDLGRAPARVVPAVIATFTEAGEALALAWSANAVATSGAHGVHYPSSITSEAKFSLGGINIETGPDSSMKQGSMGRGFELGSQNQPPHLDGLRALGPVEAALSRTAETVIRGVLP